MTEQTDLGELTDEAIARAIREFGGDVETNLHHETVSLIHTALDAADEALGAGDTDGAQNILYLTVHAMTFLFAGGGPGTRGAAAYQWASICSDVREGTSSLEIEMAYHSLREFIDMAGA